MTGFLEFFDIEASQVIRPLPVVGHNLFRERKSAVPFAIEPARRRSVPFKMLQKRRPVEAKASTGVSS
jgi:hypothetical protein